MVVAGSAGEVYVSMMNGLTRTSEMYAFKLETSDLTPRPERTTNQRGLDRGQPPSLRSQIDWAESLALMECTELQRVT